MRLSFSLLACVLALDVACGAEPSDPDRDPDGQELALSSADLEKRWIALYLPRALEQPHVIRGPVGFVALSREFVGSRVYEAIHSYIYRSDDGIRWHKVPLPGKPELFGFRGIAYARGLHVLAGTGQGMSEIWTSRDLGQWSRFQFDLGPANLHAVTHAGDWYFALGTFRDSVVSSDGASWSFLSLSATVQPSAVAFGGGRYVLVGSGSIQVSGDGVTWQERRLDCALPDACITDPSGGVHQSYKTSALYAGDAFYVGRFWSRDGDVWQLHGEPAPTDQAGGYLFSYPESTAPQPGERSIEAPAQRMSAWRPGQPPVTVELVRAPSVLTLAGGQSAAPDTIEAPLPGGETCATRRCVIVNDVLYLIP